MKNCHFVDLLHTFPEQFEEAFVEAFLQGYAYGQVFQAEALIPEAVEAYKEWRDAKLDTDTAAS